MFYWVGYIVFFVFMSDNTKQDNKLREAYIWYIAGSGINAAASFVMLLVVTRFLDASGAGVFSLAFSTAQIVLTIGKFGMRAYHATDISYDIPFGVYCSSRIICMTLMSLAELLYILAYGYEIYQAGVFASVFVIKCIEAVEDLFQGELQRCGFLGLAGKLFALRNVVTILLWTAGIYIFSDLLRAALITAAGTVLCAVVLNLFYSYRIFVIKIDWLWRDIRCLFVSCGPLFASSFLLLYIYNIPRYCLEHYRTVEEVAYYAVLFVPTFVVTLFCDFYFKPMLTSIAEIWNRRDISGIHRMLKKQLVFISICTIIAIAVIVICGPEVLGAVYGIDITEYRFELIILMIGGGGNAAVYVFTNLLVAMRRQTDIIICHAVTAIIISLLSICIIRCTGIYGASLSYLIGILVLLIMLGISVMRNIQRGRRNAYRHCDISGNE